VTRRARCGSGPEWWKGTEAGARRPHRHRPQACGRPVADRRQHRRGRTTMLSFVWPDQLDRIERLRAALDIARGRRSRWSRATRASGSGAAARRRARVTPDGGLPLDRVAVPPAPTKDGVRAALAHAARRRRPTPRSRGCGWSPRLPTRRAPPDDVADGRAGAPRAGRLPRRRHPLGLQRVAGGDGGSRRLLGSLRPP
jgi:hypothetical protein